MELNLSLEELKLGKDFTDCASHELVDDDKHRPKRYRFL
jgi:hypothetical protein